MKCCGCKRNVPTVEWRVRSRVYHLCEECMQVLNRNQITTIKEKERIDNMPAPAKMRGCSRNRTIWSL